MLYVIRSRFIEAKNRYYGFDFAPAFWGGYRIRQVPVVDASPGSDLSFSPLFENLDRSATTGSCGWNTTSGRSSAALEVDPRRTEWANRGQAPHLAGWTRGDRARRPTSASARGLDCDQSGRSALRRFRTGATLTCRPAHDKRLVVTGNAENRLSVPLILEFERHPVGEERVLVIHQLKVNVRLA